jgi:hypothetical protein
VTEWYDVSELHRQFKQACLSKFAFLTAYDFELTNINEEWYATEIVYKNQTTGIKISYETRDNDIFLYLIRLINGQIPAYIDAPSRWLCLDNLMKLRSPSRSIPRKGFGEPLTPDDIEHTLSAYAAALQEFGEDVLLGHFSVFARLAPEINQPASLGSIEEIRIVSSNKELREQKNRLPAQIVGYYDTYYYELRRRLQHPDLLSMAVPEFLKGFKRVMSIGGADGVVVAHFPIDLEISFSEVGTGRKLLSFPSVPNAEEDSYEFVQFPDIPVSNLVELISGEDIGIGNLPEGESWSVRGFNAPQLKADSTTGEMTWQAPWTRLAIADLYHLRWWESIESLCGSEGRSEQG